MPELTQNANDISIGGCGLTRAIVFRLRDSVGLLPIYGPVGVVEEIYDLPELSDIGMGSDLSQESTKRWGAPVYDGGYESHESSEGEPKRSNPLISVLRGYDERGGRTSTVLKQAYSHWEVSFRPKYQKRRRFRLAQ